MGKLNQKTILITGASGYIGKNLKAYLEKKYKIFTPSHSQLELIDSDEIRSYFRSHKIDGVIHCAVVGGSRKEEEVKNSFLTNLQIFMNIVRNKKYFNWMINLGSGAEYDKNRPIVNVREDEFDERIPRDEYGFYKYICSKYIEESKFNFINLRIFGLFGPGEDYRLRFISNAICRNLNELPITINQNVFFDYVYIEDFVKIVDYFINHKARYKSYNIGTGQKIDILTIAKKINKLADTKSKIIVKKTGLNKEYTCDNSRLMKELKNFAFTKFDISLKELYHWYKKTANSINKNTL